MAFHLFKKTIDPDCAYCKRGKLIDRETVLCKKRGVMAPGNACPAFRYEPLKRVPVRPVVPDLSRWKDEDFTL